MARWKKWEGEKKEEEDEKGKNKKVANNSQNLSKVYYWNITKDEMIIRGRERERGDKRNQISRKLEKNPVMI